MPVPLGSAVSVVRSMYVSYDMQIAACMIHLTQRDTAILDNRPPDSQKDRQTDGQTDSQTDRQTDRQTHRQTDKQRDKVTQRQTERQAVRDTTLNPLKEKKNDEGREREGKNRKAND